MINPVRGVELIEVIKTVAIWGKGTEEDPAREVVQYWGVDGTHLFTWDELEEKQKSKTEEAMR